MGPTDELVDYEGDEMAASMIWAGTDGGSMFDWGPVGHSVGDELSGDQVINLGFNPDSFLSSLDESVGCLVNTGALDTLLVNPPLLESVGRASPLSEFGFLRDLPAEERIPDVEVEIRTDSQQVLPAGDDGTRSRGIGQQEDRGRSEPHSPHDLDASEPSKGSRKQKRKCLKSKGKLSNLVLGEDVEFQEVIKMSKLTLVGRVNGRAFAIGTITKWMEEEWGFLGYVPDVAELNRRWFAFTFRTEEQARLILKRVWSIQNSPMLLKPWTPMFDASRERVDIIPIWVRLPGLPHHYWEEKFFKRIGNKIGEYLEADNSYLDTRQRKMARILVNINVREGLGEEVDMVLGPFQHTQKLDYENIPFRCRRCHEYGHLVEDCKMPLRVIKRKASKEVVRAAQSTEATAGSPSQEIIRPVGDLVIREPPLDNSLKSKKAVSDVVKKGRPSRKGSCMKWVHPTLPLAFPTGIPSAPCSSLSSLLQNLNLNLDSSGWLESLNASLNMPNSPVLKPLELEASPSSLPPRSGLVISDRTLSLDRKEGPLRNSGVDGYFLRSKSMPNPAGGLGLEKMEEGRGRGRKSFISKAKAKAKSDLLAGKQLSIDWALRAARAQDMGSQ